MFIMKFKVSLISILIISLFLSCQSDTSNVKYDELFVKLDSNETGITFKNTVVETPSMNMLTNNNIYAGGGVAVGDINNDGLQDFILISNQDMPGLYVNEGDFKFKDISKSAGLSKSAGWKTGVVMEDINADGWIDIYISKGIYSDKNPAQRKNLLYINNQNNTFTERAEEYGIANSNATVQSVFFDFDLDGDLDLYTLNQPIDTDVTDFTPQELMELRQNNTDKKNSDTFYLNNGNNKFEDVSEQVGITNWGNGLGIGLGDMNRDGYPDIYITNDFGTDNFFYINQKGKKFTDISKRVLKHVSYFAMGCDVADINNDGLLDIFEVEMLPKNRKRSVLNMESMNRGLFENFERSGFVSQYMRNSLQLNRGLGNFSEIAQIANVAKTDWSWGTLLIDADDDGYRDIFVTNGIKNDIKNRDTAREGNKLAKKSNGQLTLEQHNSIIVSTKVPNHAFQNQQNALFKDKSKDWGFDDKGFSNGLAYGDFDNDGDLDLIVNNIDDEAWLYKNTSNESGANSINFELEGYAKNKNAVGTKITVFSNGQKQFAEQNVVRGFQSSSQHLVHFGLGKSTQVDSMYVVWPDGKSDKILDPFKANKTYSLKYTAQHQPYVEVRNGKRLFAGASRSLGIQSIHQEIPFDDYKREILLPHKMSQLGPALATGDVNNDGIKDIFIGGARSFPAALHVSQNGIFNQNDSPVWLQDKIYEDIDAAFFDADGDGDQDLYVVSGSNEFEIYSDGYQDRLYLNDGTGNFTKSSNALPKIYSSGGCVEIADFDKDGDQDLFVGTRMLPGQYPLSTSSHILVNEGGKFTDKTKDICAELSNLGMVTSAKWSDYDNDGDEDLLIVGEWSGIKVFKNSDGSFKDESTNLGLDNTEGWWFHIEEIDFDKDGDIDYIVGNIGDNHKFKTSLDKPFQVFSDDFDGNGTHDIVLAFHQNDNFFPVRGRDCSSEQMPFIAEKFPTFASFGDAQMEDVFGSKLDSAYSRKASTFSSYVLENKNGKFSKIKLPIEAQFSAITGSAELDINGDNHNDLIVVGNMQNTEAETSKADASFGLCMLGNGKGNYRPLAMTEAGLYAPGDAKGLEKIEMNGATYLLIANNNSKFQSFVHKPQPGLYNY